MNTMTDNPMFSAYREGIEWFQKAFEKLTRQLDEAKMERDEARKAAKHWHQQFDAAEKRYRAACNTIGGTSAIDPSASCEVENQQNGPKTAETGKTVRLQAIFTGRYFECPGCGRSLEIISHEPGLRNLLRHDAGTYWKQCEHEGKIFKAPVISLELA